MPAPYTDAEQYDILDDLLARMAAVEGRITAVEASIDLLNPRVDAAETAVSGLQAVDAETRLFALENATVPAVDTLQEDVKILNISSKGRQENDPAELAKSQNVTRPSIERVRRPGGRIVQRVVRPR